jgi:hypothetical protein
MLAIHRGEIAFLKFDIVELYFVRNRLFEYFIHSNRDQNCQDFYSI